MLNTSSLKATTPKLSSSDNLDIPKQREIIGAAKHRRTLSSVDTQAESRNSSAKVWAEDYYTFDFGNEGGVDEETKRAGPYAPAQPPSFFTTFSSSKQEKPSPEPTRHTHTRSLTTLLPSFRSNSKSPKTSPTKETSLQEIEYDFMPTLTGDRGGVIKVADKSKGGLAAWFTGSSAPVTVGITNTEDSMATTSNSSSKEINPPKQLGSSATVAAKPATMTSRFNIFSSPKTPAQATTIQIPADLNGDELLTFDIETALFPGGRSSEDPFSPAAFKNLLMNAEGLLLKLQTAYKVRTIALHEISDEKEAMKDELDEINTRAQCYKGQIEDLAHQNSVKEERIKALERELLAEKQARSAEKEAREKSIALVRENANRERKRISDSQLSIDTQLGGEDLGIASAASSNTREWHTSDNSTGVSNVDEDSDVESRGGESVFSRSRSPTLTLNSFSASSVNLSLAGTDISTGEIMQASLAHVISPSASHPQPLRPKPVQQRSTFQKILTTITATPEPSPEKDPYDGIGLGGKGCSNCRGKNASVAWDTVGLMRAENKGLKERVGQLESANSEALDYIYDLGFSRRII